MKARRLIFALLIALTVTGCSGRVRRYRPLSTPADAGVLTIENREPVTIQVYLDYEFLGSVEPFTAWSFLVDPGQYRLSIDELGDGEGLFDYTTVAIGAGFETLVIYDDDFLDWYVDIVIRF